MVEDKYEQAKKRLQELKSEHSDLPNALRAAAITGNTEEITRLRKRQAELPNAIFEAELEFTSVKVASLRASQTERNNLLEQEYAASKVTDVRVNAEVAKLDAKRKRLTDEAQVGLVKVYRLKREIQQGAIELQAAENELRSLLEQVA